MPSPGVAPPVPLGDAVVPPPVTAGDRVAVLSPSFALPAIFPAVHELGLRRLRDDLGLVPVEYPTTSKPGASPQERVADLHAAFADPTIRAVLTTIGGDDQITLLRHLDLDLLAANPTRFFGYSDNTNLLNVLVRLGMVAYHGGSTMVHLGRAGSLHPMTLASTRAALAGGRFSLEPADRYADHAADWSDPSSLDREAWSRPAPSWWWLGDARVVTGSLWGGCLEILDWTLQVGRYVAEPAYYEGAVLFVETSDEVPPAEYVFRTLRNLGERGILEVLGGLLVARPSAQRLGETVDDDAVFAHAEAQRDAVVRAIDAYHPGLPTVIGVEAGHTDPQVVLPLGGEVRIDPTARRITLAY